MCVGVCVNLYSEKPLKTVLLQVPYMHSVYIRWNNTFSSPNIFSSPSHCREKSACLDLNKINKSIFLKEKCIAHQATQKWENKVISYKSLGSYKFHSWSLMYFINYPPKVVKSLFVFINKCSRTDRFVNSVVEISTKELFVFCASHASRLNVRLIINQRRKYALRASGRKK